MREPAYEVQNLTKRYDATQPPANDGISLTIYRGEVFGLLGPNGAGKTTLVRQLAGLSRPTSGQVRLLGHDLVRDPRRAARLVAVQPQGMSLPLHARLGELLELTGRLRGLPAATARQETKHLMEEFGLTPHAGKRIAQLSGGLQRLTACAATLIGTRPVLIFDEPTNELDPQIRRVVWRRIQRAARQGAAVILVTHNVVEAEQALDRVAIIRGGRILATGTPAELKARVARRVRLELALDPANGHPAGELLSGFSEVLHLGEHRYAVVVPRESADGAIQRLMVHLDWLADFRIVTPNLEDVYLELSGGELLGG